MTSPGKPFTHQRGTGSSVVPCFHHPAHRTAVEGTAPTLNLKGIPIATRSLLRDKYPVYLSGVLVMLGLYMTSRFSYLLFHTIAKLFSVLIAFSTFLLAWNSRRFLDNNYLLFLGIALPFIGGVDLLHALSFPGMGIFVLHDANLTAQLWITGRYLTGLSLLVAPIFACGSLSPRRVLLAFAAFSSLLLYSIFAGLFPVCYVEGQGLTPFNQVSELVITITLIAAIVGLGRNRARLEDDMYRYLVAAIVAIIAAGLALTLLTPVYSATGVVGPLLNIAAFYLVYKALIEAGLTRPYDLLFRNLKQSEQELKRHQSQREELVLARTADLTRANQQLQEHTAERFRLLTQTQEQAHQVRHIVDTVPEGVLLLSADLEVILVNPLAKEYLAQLAGAGTGDTLSHLGGHPLVELLTSPPVGFWHDLAAEDRTFQMIARPMEAGVEPGGWVLVIRDVTEERDVRQRTEQQERLAAVGQLVAGIAHDFSNTMSIIMLYAQMVARTEGLPDKPRDQVAVGQTKIKDVLC